MQIGEQAASPLERPMSASKLRVYHKLKIAAHRLQTEADSALHQASGMSTAQAAVMAVVARSKDATQRSVAEQLGINESAMTAMTTRLIGLGLVERMRNRTDARAWRLTLTPEGRAAMNRTARPFDAINARIEKICSAEELAILADILDRIGAEFRKRED